MWRFFYGFYTVLPAFKKGVIFAKNKIHTEWK